VLFRSHRRRCRRFEACHRHGLKIHLYHSLNHWTTKPDGSDALEDPADKIKFVDFAHERLKELLELFNPIDCLWYDGWWPFNAEGWRAKKMNAMARQIQPHIIVNGRNGLPGDFGTPEGHLSAPCPWRPWEACMPHNKHWGYHAGDNAWKSSAEIVDMLTQVAAGSGNLLINVGLDPEGAMPEPSSSVLEEVGQWMELHGEAIYESERFDYNLRERGNHRGDWFHHGRMTCVGKKLYIHLFNWPGKEFGINGVEVNAESCCLLNSRVNIDMQKDGKRLLFSNLPDKPPHPLGGVLKIEFKKPPMIYNLGGMRVPSVPHPRYDPCPSDIQI